ncbi:MAG TPA: hypothetical protein VGR37_18130, partial [Longimicrobiaceae bacterium]|nr:hypothetical protein [Longimicrobiaceae bacterium]
MTTDRLHRAFVLLLGMLISAPAMAAQDAGPGVGVSVRIGVAGGSLCRAAVVPGVEVRTGGTAYAVAVLDTYLFRTGDRDPCGTERTAGGGEEVTRVPLTAPRMRAGVGWAGAAGGMRT